MGTEIEQVHSAVRRYCVTHADRWKDEYNEMLRRNERPARSGLLRRLGLKVSDRDPEGPSIFPRYLFLDRALLEFERSVPQDFTSVHELRAFAKSAAQSALDEVTRPPGVTLQPDDVPSLDDLRRLIAEQGGPVRVEFASPTASADRALENRSATDERDAFLAFVATLAPLDAGREPPMPFRRTLNGDEVKEGWNSLASIWGVGGHWYPLDRNPEDEPPADTVAFDARAFFDLRLLTALRSCLRVLGVEHITEIRESGDENYEIELAIFEPHYNFQQGFWFDESRSWLVYASHEGSVTISGKFLLTQLQSRWQNWSDYLYRAGRPEERRIVGPGVESVRFEISEE